MPIAPSHSEFRAHLEPARSSEDAPDLLEVGLRRGRRPPPCVRRGRVADRPDGSPTWAVKSPMISTATWPEVLELAELAQHDREAEVDVGRGRVDAELHPQRRARRRACGAARPR